jgi:hypothetical protein
VPSIAERLATLEADARSHLARLDAIEDIVSGGGDIEYGRSVRGRLHTIEGTLAGFVLRRNFGHAFGRGWVQAVLAIAVVATAAAAWYSILFG